MVDQIGWSAIFGFYKLPQRKNFGSRSRLSSKSFRLHFQATPEKTPGRQGGHENQTGGILSIFRDLIQAPYKVYLP